MYEGRRKLLHDLDDYKGEGVMIMCFYFPCSVYMDCCKVEPSEIIEQAMIILVEGRSLELYNQTHGL